MNDITKICVTRHGETDWNITGILQGWIEVPLNDKGRQQAHEFSATARDLGVTCVYTSPLVRALETAEIIADQLKLPPPTCHDGLKERHFGFFQGRPKEELRVTHPELLENILRRNPATEFEGGESMDGFATRVLAAIADIAVARPRERVLVITHGWVMDVVTRHISHLPRHAILNMKRKNMEYVWLDVTRHCIAASPHSAVDDS